MAILLKEFVNNLKTFNQMLCTINNWVSFSFCNPNFIVIALHFPLDSCLEKKKAIFPKIKEIVKWQFSWAEVPTCKIFLGRNFKI